MEIYSLYRQKNKNEFEIIALVLARKGSKRIKNKNLKSINGNSLLGRTLIQIINSGIFKEIWVSTDGDEIAEEAKNCKLWFWLVLYILQIFENPTSCQGITAALISAQ